MSWDVFAFFCVIMNFYGLKDFYINRLLFKAVYIAMPEDKKRLYKRFVYSISFENEYVKDVIWEYLNDDENSEENITRVYNQRMRRNKCK